MQQFNDEKGVRREICLSNLKLGEVEDIIHQFCTLSKYQKKQWIRELKKRITTLEKQSEVSEWILGIHDTSGKLFGIVEVYSKDNETATLLVEIPNEMKGYKYGVKTIRQIAKICGENHCLKTIILNEDDPIDKRYMRYYNMDTNSIDIKSIGA